VTGTLLTVEGAMKKREPERSRRPSIRAAIALLDNPEFCQDGQKILSAIADLAEASAVPPDELPAPVMKLCIDFGKKWGVALPLGKKWGVAPPLSAELIDPDPRRRYVAAIAAGHWGLVPIFPWTTRRQIEVAARRIRKSMAKQHSDAENPHRVRLAQWLEESGFSRREIARAVWGRRRGLWRPTKAEAIRGLPEAREKELLLRFRKQYPDPKKAERFLYQKIRGSEAPASAAVRAAESRYVEGLEGLNKDLATPVHTEPVSSAVTSLLRAAFVAQSYSEIRRQLAALRDALIRPPST